MGNTDDLVKVDTTEYCNVTVLKSLNKTLQYVTATMSTVRGRWGAKEQLRPLFYIQLLEENRQITQDSILLAGKEQQTFQILND